MTRSIVDQLSQQLNGSNIRSQIPYLEDIDFRFSDSEVGVRLDVDVSGSDVFLFQALFDPATGGSVDENYLALLVAARTLREWGAHKVTAVLPYLAYSRQDKPTRFQREPTTAKLMADLAISAGVDRLVTWHPHYQQIHGFYSGIPVDVMQAHDYFVDVFKDYHGREDVVLVAPDIGASKFVTYLGRSLELQVAIASKFHPEREQTMITQIIGDLSNKRIALVVDDMMSSGGTMFGVVQKLVNEYAIEQVLLGVSHNLCSDKAHQRLLRLRENDHLQQLYVTNSIPQSENFAELPFVTVHDLTATLTQTIMRIHFERS
ncbi:MAG: ribose-phosphate pyrophosphokinase [Chloroflexi bacterium]|nr:ribose-phosphate pyrophosphokinase [Chloroflexota bacterium]